MHDNTLCVGARRVAACSLALFMMAPVVVPTAALAAATPLEALAEGTKAPATYTVRVERGEGGVVLPGAEEDLAGAVLVEAGSAQSFTIVPDEGYVVGTVLYNDVERKGLMGSFTVTPTADSNIQVTFVTERAAGLTDAEPGWHTTADGSLYWRDADGRLGRGLREIEGKTYAFRADGLALTGWQPMQEGWRYFGADGAMRVGWQEISGSIFYFGETGVMQTGWQQVGKAWCYFRPSGSLAGSWDSVQRGWAKANGAWFFFDASDNMVVGWLNNGRYRYHFAENGAMDTGWVAVDGKWYYFDKVSGAMKTGWVKDSGYWFYLGKDGSMLSGWFKVDGLWYATKPSGKLLQETWGYDAETDLDYYFGKDGAWTGQTRTHKG